MRVFPYGRAARLLLLGAVAFWWGGYVTTHLFSAAFPALLPPSNAVLGGLNASREGTIANAVSAATLASVTLLLIAAAVGSRRRSAGWIAVGGWAALAVTTAALAFEELAEFKKGGPFSVVDHAWSLGVTWPVLVSPLVIAFLLAMYIFIRKGLDGASCSAPLILGIGCWVFALFHEVVDPWLFYGRARWIGYVLEETLEYSGTLLIGFSAAIALGGGCPRAHPVFGGRWRWPLVGSVAAVVMLGGIAFVFLFRAPLVEALAPNTRAGAFGVSLQHQEALVQELRMPATPVQSIRLLPMNCGTESGPGTVAVRVTDPGMSNRIRSEGSVEIPVGDCPRWRDIEMLPPITAAEGELLDVQVVADIEPGAELRIGATKGDRYADGRLWINGELAWQDQNLEFVAYGSAAPTRSKFQGVWDVLISDWRWPALLADLAIALTLIAFVPALLVASAEPLRTIFPRR